MKSLCKGVMASVDAVQAMHDELVPVAVAKLRADKGWYLNGISAHSTQSTITLGMLVEFESEVLKMHKRACVFVGSVDGALIASVRLQPPGPRLCDASGPASGPGSGRKRKSPDAMAQVDDLIRSLSKEHEPSIGKADIDEARPLLKRLVELRDDCGDSALEAIGMNVVRDSRIDPSPVLASATPKIVISVRLGANFAFSAAKLKETLSSCADAALTTAGDLLVPQLQLPLPRRTRITDLIGQTPMLIYAVLPLTPCGPTRDAPVPACADDEQLTKRQRT